MNQFSMFAWNVFLNSFMTFFTIVFLIEGVIFLFRIRQGRCTSCLRMFPILKLPLDLFLYDFSRWSYMHGVNPLTCEKGTRSLSIFLEWMNNWLWSPIHMGIQMTAPGNTTFTIADLLGQFMNLSFLYFFAIALFSFSICFFVKKVIFQCRFVIHLRFLKRKGATKNKKIRNAILVDCLKKRRMQIVTSRFFTGSPFVAGLISPVVYVPSILPKDLSRKEYEAVLAHEIEHSRKKDPLLLLLLDFIGSVFFWVPTKWLRKRIEEGQEIGCDWKCKNYGVNSIDLAAAICKFAKDSLSPPQILGNSFTKHPIHKRVHLLLQTTSSRWKKTELLFSFLAMGIALFVIFFGRFWIF